MMAKRDAKAMLCDGLVLSKEFDGAELKWTLITYANPAPTGLINSRFEKQYNAHADKKASTSVLPRICFAGRSRLEVCGRGRHGSLKDNTICGL